MKRVIALGAVCTGLACGGSPAIANAATSVGQAASAPAAQVARGVTYTRKTVVIPRKVVRANLVGIAPGGVFKFRHRAGPLRRLKVGSVMLLQGSAAGTVTAITTQHGRLIVKTRDAPLAAIVKSGSISYSGRPDIRHAFVAPIDQPGSHAAAASVRPQRFVSPGFPYVAGPLAHTASGPALSLQGGKGPLGYSVTAEPTGPSSLHLSGTICYGHGDICANGPASGISLEASFDGTVDLSRISGDVNLAGGSIDKLQAAFKDVKSKFKVEYTFARGEGGPGSLTFPAFHIPLGIDIPIPGPIPLFARVQLGLLLQVLSKPGKNTVSHGAMEGQVAGSATIDRGTGGGGASPSGADGSASVSAGTQGLGISPGVLGLVVATQIKTGIAVGVTVANVLAYTDYVGSIGQEQASAFAGGFCSSYIGVLTWGAGIEAQLGGGALGISTGKKWELKKWNSYFTEPGCKKIDS